jgi:hypothetical protein
MSANYFYFEGADGRRYCYAGEPSFRCPIGAIERDPIAEDAGFILTPAIENAAAELDLDPQFLAERLKHSAGRARVGGKLVEKCITCGTKLERLGYRYWIMAKVSDEGAREANARIADRLGFNADGFVTVEGSWYAETRKAAKAWALGRKRETDRVAA